MIVAGLAVGLLTTPLPGQKANIPPPNQDPFVGLWKANAKESRPRLDRKEASYERKIQRDGDGLVFISSGGPAGSAVRQFKIRCDGIFHPLPTGPVLSCLYAAPNRVEGETKTPLKTDVFWTREVSSDGSRMTISEYKDKGRTKIRSIMVLDRIK